MATDPFDGDKAFTELVFLALDHGTGSIEESEAGPLIPFAMALAGGAKKLNRFLGRDYAADVESALRFAREGGFDAWAVAWDGYLTHEGRRTDAVFVRAARRSGDGEVLFAWRYDRPPPAGKLRRLGNPAFLGREPAGGKP